MGRGTELLEGCFCRLDGTLDGEGGCEGSRGEHAVRGEEGVCRMGVMAQGAGLRDV